MNVVIINPDRTTEIIAGAQFPMPPSRSLCQARLRLLSAGEARNGWLRDTVTIGT